MIAKVTRALLTISVLTLASALIWWWNTYGAVVGYGYLSWPEAGRCLVGDSDICSLAKALCSGSHPRAFIAYWSRAFWGSLALLSVSLALFGGRDRSGV